MATTERALVVHSSDIDHRRHFPNSVLLFEPRGAGGRGANPYEQALREIPPASYRLVVCTGLLEHVPDPAGLVGAFHRVLAPGGRLILSASAVFPFHGGSENFFHFTPNGLRLLFADWTRFEVLRGSTQPFETIGVLLQRIAMQCDVVPPLRWAIRVVAPALPWLDVFVRRQYDRNRRDPAYRTDAFMPAALHAVVVK